MAKKSASESKIKKVEKNVSVNPEKEFEDFIKIEKMKLETEIRHTKLPDSYIGMEKMWESFYTDSGKPSFDEVMTHLDTLREFLSAMLATLDSLTYAEFSAEEYADPYEGLLADLDACENRDDVFVSFMLFSFWRTYGEHLVELWRLIRESIEA